ncbi:hypothetical protein AAVH_07634 [Aphelenchoides avenae]|nr:hypothetical protein AAVH_07634 [Aphelenchus avenae]
MRSYVIFLALLPLCFAAPNSHLRGDVVDRELLAGRSCLMECQTDVHGQFNLTTSSRPRGYRQFCDFAQKLSQCLEKCPESPASPLMKQDAETNQKICGKGFDERKFEELRQGQNRMSEQWAYQTISSCSKQSESFDPSRMFEKCSLFLDCFLGDALTAVKDGYDSLVVASVIVPLKLEYVQKIGGGVWTEAVVDECSVLFTPFKADHMNANSMPAPSCLLYCQTVVPAKYPDALQSAQQLQKATYCEYSNELSDCLGQCQESPITPVIKQSDEVNARICGPDFSEEQLKAFFDGLKSLSNEWYRHVDSCSANGPRLAGRDWAEFFEECSIYLNCFLGETFDAVKDDYDELVVAALSAQFKLQYARLVARGEWTEAVADECPAVFKPYEARNASAMA